MRQDDEQLLDFCVEHYQRFNTNAWLLYSDQTRIKIAALLLSCSHWYQKIPELDQLCSLGGWQKDSLPESVKAARFDCARFVAMLKHRLSLL